MRVPCALQSAPAANGYRHSSCLAGAGARLHILVLPCLGCDVLEVIVMRGVALRLPLAVRPAALGLVLLAIGRGVLAAAMGFRVWEMRVHSACMSINFAFAAALRQR